MLLNRMHEIEHRTEGNKNISTCHKKDKQYGSDKRETGFQAKKIALMEVREEEEGEEEEEEEE